MKKTSVLCKVKISLLFITIIAFTSCANKFGNAANEYKIKSGETFEVKLKANPTTGMRWLFSEELDSTIIKLDTKKYIANENETNMAGKGGNEILTFKGISKGLIDIKLTYGKSVADTSETKILKVKVK